ncbi:MAG: cytidine deaminase [Puniceicoccaceae bacterium]
MKPVKRSELSTAEQDCLVQVEAALGNSYSPYSGLCVGAGILLEDGKIVVGINYESASYGLTLCAERTAIARAQAQGVALDTVGMIISARHSDAAKAPFNLTPCGACRQWIAELSKRTGRDFPVTCFWDGEESGLQGSAQNLLPEAFL